ncbi:hypothetical protein RJ640_022542 [Escallonia rubra]|uniref:Uncharacterized protein n=1 Tax=Escallonia rubra TaxID=112253 RepID=A0AA88UNQ1_9ASTE|nr:hypothetical protein RJ640_022542 [Escallonia rubra]
MNQEVVKVILECKKDIWKNQELFELVEEYFENSLQTLDFCAALEKCLKRARDSQLLILFEEEDGVEENRYTRTLEELRNFKAAGDPFTEDFFQIFQSLYRQHMLMLEKLQMRKSKLDKKLKSVHAWRKLSSVIFVATFAAVLICSVVAAAMAAPPVTAALAAASSVPPGSMGKLIDSLFKNYETAVRAQKEVISSMQVVCYQRMCLTSSWTDDDMIQYPPLQAQRINDVELGPKYTKSRERQWFCEDVRWLVHGGNESNIQRFASYMLPNKMIVNFNMLSSGMENRIK